MLGGWAGLLTWRKAMVTLSSVPGDYSRVLSQMSRQVPSISRLRQVLDDLVGPIDVVNGFNISWENAMFAGWEWARRHGIPFVATPFMHFGGADDVRVVRNSMMDHQQQMLRTASAILTLTDIEADGLRQRGIVAPRIETIGGGSDPLPEEIDPAAAIAQYNVHPPYAIFIGRASRDKGALDAAQAVLRLRRRLVLVGQPTEEFDRFYESLNSAEQAAITHLGILPEADKHGLLAGAEMLLLPSRVDSFGIVLLEAWAHRKPVVAADAGGIPGVVTHQQDGLLAPYGNVQALARAVKRLFDDPALADALGSAGHAQLTTRFNWAQVSDHVLRIYADLIDAA